MKLFNEQMRLFNEPMKLFSELIKLCNEPMKLSFFFNILNCFFFSRFRSQLTNEELVLPDMENFEAVSHPNHD